MSYVQKTLLPEEKIIYHTKPHYAIFYPVFLWLAATIWFFSSDHIILSPFFGNMLLLGSVFSCVSSLINYYCSEYAITSKRVIMKIGFIRRKSLEIFLDRIEGIYVDQGIFGRILGFGTVSVGGIGGTKDPFFYIPDPIKFRNAVQHQIACENSRLT